MVAKSKEFHCVTVDRDRTPEIPERLQVSAYPSVLVLGRDEENVLRFAGFSKKAAKLRRPAARAMSFLFLSKKGWRP